MSARKRWPASMSLLLLWMLVLQLSGSDLGAYQRDGGGCGLFGPTISYQFVDNKVGTKWYRWTDARKARARAGFESWEEILDLDGQPIADVGESTSPQFFVYFVKEIPSSDPKKDPAAQVKCFGPPAIEFEQQLRTNHEALEDLAAHEMGHALGLAHSAPNDSADGDRPTMVSCSGRDMSTLQQDDWAALTQRHGSSAFMNADPSFENGQRFWSVREASAIRVFESSPSMRAPSGGPYHYRFKRTDGPPDELKGRIVQTVRVMRPGTIAAAGAVRKLNSEDGGTVLVAVRWKGLLYERETDVGDCFPEAWVEDKPTNEKTKVRTILVPPANLGWQFQVSEGTRVKCKYSWLDPRICGANLRIMVRNAMYDRNTGDPAWAVVDDVGVVPWF